jgi:hypothetical protein
MPTVVQTAYKFGTVFNPEQFLFKELARVFNDVCYGGFEANRYERRYEIIFRSKAFSTRADMGGNPLYSLVTGLRRGT